MQLVRVSYRPCSNCWHPLKYLINKGLRAPFPAGLDQTLPFWRISNVSVVKDKQQAFCKVFGQLNP